MCSGPEPIEKLQRGSYCKNEGGAARCFGTLRWQLFFDIVSGGRIFCRPLADSQLSHLVEEGLIVDIQ
jgi:hypothetical protein